MNKYDASYLSLIALNATEKAAIAAYGLLGRADEKEADRLATSAMREYLNNTAIEGIVKIGEGERDKAPMLYIGEELGAGGIKVDIAVDPLEGTKLLVQGGQNALSVIAVAPSGGFLHAPDVYMDKIAIGFDFKEQLIDLDNSVYENLKNIAVAKNCNISDLLVIVLDRKRHEELIAKIREAGARVKLISDGDILGVISTASIFFAADVYMGVGGAPEGVLAAAALQQIGGQMCTRLLFSNEEERQRATGMGIRDLERQYYLNDLAAKTVIFSATAVTDGQFLQGVRANKEEFITSSVIMQQGQIKKIQTYHKIY